MENLRAVKLITEEAVDVKIVESVDNSGAKNLFLEGVYSTHSVKNKNGRMYKKELLEREVNNILPKIKQKKLFGELNHPSCYWTDDFYVLGEHGWTHFTDIKVGDKVFGMDEFGNGILTEVKKVINEPYEGLYYRLKGKSWDFKVTPNHRFYLRNRKDDILVKTAKELSFETMRKYGIIKTADFSSISIEENIILPGVNLESIDKEARRYISEEELRDLVINAEDFCWFLGFWLAEGASLGHKGNISSVCQKEGKKAEIIRQKIKKLPFYSIREKGNGELKAWDIKDRRLADYLRVLGKIDTKHIPESIKNLHPKALWSLIEGFALGDGRIDKKTGRILNMFSVSKQLIDDLHECAIKCGLSGRVHTYICDKDYIYCGHLVKAENKRPLYQLNLSYSPVFTFANPYPFEKVYEKGKACCLTTDTGNFFIRFPNSQSFLSGNSPEINLERACILIESVDWNNADLLGKSSILDTALGKTVAACIKRGVVGISSRGLGTVSESGWVNNDFQLLTWDVVSDPSNQKSWVKGICESKTYYINESGIIVKEESSLTNSQKQDAINTAVSEMEAKAREMAEAIVEERLGNIKLVLKDAKEEIIRLRSLAGLTNEQLNNVKEENGEITEEQATRIFKEIVKENLKESLSKLF